MSWTGDLQCSSFTASAVTTCSRNVLFIRLRLHLFSLSLYARTLWGDCSTCVKDNDPEWKCPSAARAYNDLMGNTAGTAANIIELDGGRGESCLTHIAVCTGENIVHYSRIIDVPFKRKCE